MSKQPPSEYVEAAKKVMLELGASKVLIEKSEGWDFDTDDTEAVLSGNHVMYHITAYKGGKSIASSGGETVECAVRNTIKRESKDPEED
jgi:hypothetical protein